MGSRDRKGCEPWQARAIRNPAGESSRPRRPAAQQPLSPSGGSGENCAWKTKLGACGPRRFAPRLALSTAGKKVEVLLLSARAQSRRANEIASAAAGPPGRHVHGRGTGWVTLSRGLRGPRGARCLFLALLASPRCGEDVQANISDPPLPPHTHPEEVSRRAPLSRPEPAGPQFPLAGLSVGFPGPAARSSACPPSGLLGRMNPGHTREGWVWRSGPPVPRAALPACGRLSGSWSIVPASTHGSVQVCQEFTVTMAPEHHRIRWCLRGFGPSGLGSC